MRGSQLLPVLALGACARGASVAPAPTPDAAAELRTAIDSMVEDPIFRNAHWGILIVDPGTGDTLYSRNAGKLFMPASNQKLLTGAVALAQLGADFRFRTTFVAHGPVRDGVLDGDLAVVGRGDPSISDAMLGSAARGLEAFADSLAARGIRRIEGRLVSGANTFPDPPLGFGWAWDDLPYAYSAGVDELMVNEGFAAIQVRAGANPGEVAVFTMSPVRGYPAVLMQAQTIVNVAQGRPNLSWELNTPGDTIRVSGQIPAGDSARIAVAYRDQTRAFLTGLRETLEARGIAVGGGTRPAERADTLFASLSPPLRDILPVMQKPSQNQIAEILYKTLGLERKGVGTADSGRRVVEGQLREWGVDTAGMAVRDGSGLSRHNYATPETIVRVLDAMRRSPHFGTYYSALPLAGAEGTLRNRMRGTPAAGNVRAKTGYIDKARSLSGYVTAADGRVLLFSFLANNWTVPIGRVERVQDAIAARLAVLQLPADPRRVLPPR